MNQPFRIKAGYEQLPILLLRSNWLPPKFIFIEEIMVELKTEQKVPGSEISQP